MQHLIHRCLSVDLSAPSSASLIPDFPSSRLSLASCRGLRGILSGPLIRSPPTRKHNGQPIRSPQVRPGRIANGLPQRRSRTHGVTSGITLRLQECPTLKGSPDSFKPDKKHLDSKEVYGKTMLRKVAPTSWASKYRLAGRDISDIRLTDLLWRGWNNHHLRALSHGQYVSLVIARKVNESVLSSQLLTAIREQKWDLDELECLQPFSTASSAASSSDQTQLIADLQAQLEAEKAKNKAPSPPAMSQPPAKRIRLCSKTATVGGLPIQASSSCNPSQELVDKALDPTCQLTARIFQQYPTQGVAKTNISKWLKNIKAKVGPEKAQSIEKALDLAQQMQPCLDPMIIQQLRDKCAQIGLPVQWATKIKEPEIHQVLIAATCIAD